MAISCGLVGFGTVGLLVPLILRCCACGRFQRVPAWHHTDGSRVPRFGGAALVGAFVAVELFINVLLPGEWARIPERLAVIVSALAMFALGFWDDVKPLGAKRKLTLQVAIAGLVYLSGVAIETFKVPFTNRMIDLAGWGAPVTVLWLVGITNLLNLIDGVDGLASGIALMVMALLVYVGLSSGTFVLLTAGMTGALLAFLCFNFPPARIYLGDGGAYFLGLLIALFALIGSHKGSVFAVLAAPLFVLAVPIVDTGLAILRRGLRGLPVFRPDRLHLHHHLLRSGLSRRQVVLWLYGVTLIFSLMGFAAFWSRGELIPVLLGGAAVVLLLCAGRWSFSRQWFALGRTLGSSLAMRGDIQYALALMSWLRQEGGRCASVEGLYEDLVFAAERMGFNYVKLILADGERVWHRAMAEPCHGVRHELLDGAFGVLELRAPACGKDPGKGSGPLGDQQRMADHRLFEIMADLLAEGWLSAAAQPRFGPGPLRFNQRGSPMRSRVAHRGKLSLQETFVQSGIEGTPH